MCSLVIQSSGSWWYIRLYIQLFSLVISYIDPASLSAFCMFEGLPLPVSRILRGRSYFLCNYSCQLFRQWQYMPAQVGWVRCLSTKMSWCQSSTLKAILKMITLRLASRGWEDYAHLWGSVVFNLSPLACAEVKLSPAQIYKAYACNSIQPFWEVSWYLPVTDQCMVGHVSQPWQKCLWMIVNVMIGCWA